MTGKLQRSLSGYHVSDVCFIVEIKLLNVIMNFENLVGQPDPDNCLSLVLYHRRQQVVQSKVPSTLFSMGS